MIFLPWIRNTQNAGKNWGGEENGEFRIESRDGGRGIMNWLVRAMRYNQDLCLVSKEKDTFIGK